MSDELQSQPANIEVLPAKDPWLQADAEPTNWYNQFQIFLGLGAGRSVLKAAQKSTGKPLKQPSGAWKQAAIRWNWASRADAFDKSQLTKSNETASSLKQRMEMANQEAMTMISEIIRDCIKDPTDESYAKHSRKLNMLIFGKGRAADTLIQMYRVIFGEKHQVQNTHKFEKFVAEFE